MKKPYMHVERLGRDEVEGILDGECLVFPKVDGTNGRVWRENGKIRFGSRKRVLGGIENDNQGFVANMVGDEAVMKWLHEFFNSKEWSSGVDVTIFGEWLVPHTLKTYRDDAWRKFYIFDVAITERSTGGYLYIPYKEYKEIFDRLGDIPEKIEIIPPLCFLSGASVDDANKLVYRNTYLMKEGFVGEGVVIKRYDFTNKYGRTVWAKVVRGAFKDEHLATSRIPTVKGATTKEQLFVEEFLTKDTIDKIKAKMGVAVIGGKDIPKFLGIAYHDFITEEMWSIIRKFEPQTIDLTRLRKFVETKAKELGGVS